MSNKETLENIKKLREITGVGFKDCKLAIDENLQSVSDDAKEEDTANIKE